MAETPTHSTPNRNSNLTFREVTEDNWRAVANLSLQPGQTGNLAPNVWSLCEAHYSEDAWVRAIYADETLVGMLMMAIWDPDEAYYIWRFMIDGRYQGLGYGRRGVEFAIAHIRQHNPRAKTLGVMSTPPEGKKSENPLKNVKPEDSPCAATFMKVLRVNQSMVTLGECSDCPLGIHWIPALPLHGVKGC